MPIVHGDRLSDAFTDEQKCFKKFWVKKLPRLLLLECTVNMLADKFLDVEVIFYCSHFCSFMVYVIVANIAAATTAFSIAL